MPTSTAFRELTGALYGEYVDADALEAIVKMSPDSADVHAPAGLRAVPTRRRRPVAKRGPRTQQEQEHLERNVARVSNGVGLAAGIGGTATAVQNYRQVKRDPSQGGWLTGKVAQKTGMSRKGAARLAAVGAGSALGLQTANVLGDVVTARVLGRGGKKQPVDKGLGDFAAGSQARLQVMNRALARATGDATRNAHPDDVEFAGSFSKFDEDKRLAFGWASVVKVDGQPVVDRQGDYIGIDDIEEAAYVYVEKSRVGGDMHRRAAGNLGSDLEKGEDRPHKVGELVESMVFTPEKIAKMGLPSDFPVGWWVGYKIHDDDAWAEVKKGNRTGFSIHGKGIRRAVDYDSLLEA